MTDLDARHPTLGDISPATTPELSRKFEAIREVLNAEGHSYSGDPSLAWLDDTAACRLVAARMGLESPRGYFTVEEYRGALANADWGDGAVARRAELFIRVCLEEGLDIAFT